MNRQLPHLATPLPENVLKLKAAGFFDEALRQIDLYLKREIPTSLRERLLQEREIIPIIQDAYPYSETQARQMLAESVKDFQPEEFQTLVDEDAIDWVFINGEKYYRENFLLNIMKTRADYAARCQNPDLIDQRTANLNEVMHKMKANGELTYRIHLRSTFKVKDHAQKPGELLRLHLPLPVEYAQVENFKLLHTSHTPTAIAPRDALARSIYFEKPYEAGEEFQIEYVFDNHMIYVKPDPEKVTADQPTFYTEESYPHIKFTPYIRSVAEEIVGQEKNPLLKAWKIYEYITTHVKYSFMRPYYAITDIPAYTLTGFKGDCGIQALTFIALCRAVGVPARWQAGLYTNPVTIGNHDWAQFYVAPYGWLFADCSFGGSAFRAGEKERWEFYFGNLEPFRMPASAEFQADFNPALQFTRNDPYDNQNGEAEFESGKLFYEDIEIVEEIISIKELPKESDSK
ncbi:transglutaminase-like domain-containing protein [Allofustis seminis]|uniref:transglutaminase-like domain-containing protein n=1 Tax=Allofustis seminis TaxID=166939 RepID=UPI000368B428|nr:transglutaminase-like domain-containing protein [Allofustis seminis]